MQIISGIPNEIFSLTIALLGSLVYFIYSVFKSGAISIVKSLWESNNNEYLNQHRADDAINENNINSDKECSICLNNANFEIVTSCNHYFCGNNRYYFIFLFSYCIIQ